MLGKIIIIVDLQSFKLFKVKKDPLQRESMELLGEKYKKNMKLNLHLDLTKISNEKLLEHFSNEK